ncbi:TMEM164 family acyltransferase [Mycoplasmopsis bovirhinis]|uniref:Integral membrane protein (Intg_mem_TP0381) n=1 Tax=Mycoplasmopsis bovirhinis TaxID=29553 RepID=A0A449AE72_9BACT|nr:YwaF family protein [Mycoplasmopsis bovirhinis]VEU63266.1 Integral membrane protein (intg_mem_TP0381) [Mycoplasmopsis bovirhinis]
MNFWHYRRNIADFSSSRPLFLSFFVLSLFVILFLYIYLKRVYNYFNQEGKKFIFKTLSLENLFVAIGIFTTIYNLIRLGFLIGIDYPYKWELFPLHLCRFFSFTIPLLYIFKKGPKINMVSILAVFGAIFGFLFADLGADPVATQIDREYNNLKEGTREWNNAGFNLGYDNVLFWDFIFAHSFVLIMPVFTHIVYGPKAKIKLRNFVQGSALMLGMLVLVLIGNIVLFQGIKNSNNRVQIQWTSNWFYLGAKGINTLGKLSKWPFSPIIFGLAGVLVNILGYIFYMFMSSIDFEFNKYYMPNKVTRKRFKDVWNELKTPWKKVLNFRIEE